MILALEQSIWAASTQGEIVDISVAGSLAVLRDLAVKTTSLESFQAETVPQLGVIFNLAPAHTEGMQLVLGVIESPAEAPLMRMSLLTLVGPWRLPSAMRAAERLALNEPDEKVRMFAVQALGASGLPEEFATLVRVWRNDSSAVAKAVAIMGLGAVGNRYEWQRMTDALKTSLKAQNAPFDVENPALYKAGPLLRDAQESEAEAIFGDALSNPDYQIRMAAADAIAMRHSRNMEPNLIGALGDENPQKRTASGSTPGVWYENKMVKIKVLSALQRIGDSRMEQSVLLAFSSEKDEDVVAAYLDTMGTIGSTASINVIGQMLGSDDELYVLHAALAAQSLHAASLIPAIRTRAATIKDEYVAQRLSEVLNAMAH